MTACKLLQSWPCRALRDPRRPCSTHKHVGRVSRSRLEQPSFAFPRPGDHLKCPTQSPSASRSRFMAGSRHSECQVMGAPS